MGSGTIRVSLLWAAVLPHEGVNAEIGKSSDALHH